MESRNLASRSLTLRTADIGEKSNDQHRLVRQNDHCLGNSGPRIDERKTVLQVSLRGRKKKLFFLDFEQRHMHNDNDPPTN